MKTEKKALTNPRYRTSCIKSRIIPLTREFVSYIREDGILLADDDDDIKKTNSKLGSLSLDDSNNNDDDGDDEDWEPTVPSTGRFRPPEAQSPSDSDSDSDTKETPPKLPPNRRFPALHDSITTAIATLGGAAAPKLNWSSPKDATWISRHPNTVKCTTANDVYLLLKSSSFISHDLDYAFADTEPAGPPPPGASSPPYTPVLVLRAFFSPLPSLEFRCFVKERNLIGITQRDLHYYKFLHGMRGAVVTRVRELFKKMRFTFPDANWVFDVYIPEADYDSDDDDDESETSRARLGRARLIDINPWAPRTDSLLFDWGELLNVQVARPFIGSAISQDENGEVSATDEDETSDGEAEADHEPELRLVEQDDPAAYNFSSPQYSAHKLPKDVVDASMAGEGGMREFAREWQRITEGRAQDVSSDKTES